MLERNPDTLDARNVPVNVDPLPRNTGEAPQSCSTMPAQFGSSIKLPGVGTLSMVAEKYQCLFCASGAKKSRFRSSVAT